MRIRPLHTADAGTVAALHAASWRRAYRGILTYAYLDSDLEAERHAVGGWTTVHTPDVGVHLWVFADNVAARGFYRRVGGREVERTDRAAADGRQLPEYRVAWSSPGALTGATRGEPPEDRERPAGSRPSARRGYW
ncbi:hypothetical protein [Gemmatimonas sp.]|uniref:hypothetical protein n=1 Tax=Gemmatimonas sp. TaxID=1962908 RepID=UPI0025BDBB38|nr:hypothetical protein [Gemmatimonas sp.]MCA2990971.1 hypothetical protein [Gemmatimonas sp.]